MPLANSRRDARIAVRSGQRAFTSATVFHCCILLQPNKRAAFAALQSASLAVQHSPPLDQQPHQTMADFSLGPSQADADAFMREAQQKPEINDDDETVAPDHRSEGPVVTILIGMAGCGKTTLFHRLHYDAQEKGRRCYFVNLDPAVLEVPIEPQIDIRGIP